MSDFMKRITAIAMSMVLVLCLIPTIAFADGGQDDAETVRVYFTLSDDSEFITGNDADGRVMTRVPIDVPYVDLQEYGLEAYNRYEAKPFEEGGQYKNDVLVEQPTLLMCFIKALSQYYLCRDFRASDVGTQALQTSGGATSLYLLYFWGHFYNFMYFVNHEYPLMAKGWGATADYILLEDGDEIDVGMFTDLRFNQYGGFAYFDSGNENITAGDSLNLQLYLTKSQESGGSDYNGPMYKEPIRISGDYGRTWQTKVYTTDKQGQFTAAFDEAGVYYVSAGPVFKNQPYSSLQCIAPPICVVEVRPAPVTSGSVQAEGNSFSVSWAESPGAEAYEVKYKASTGSTKTITTEDTSISVTDADPEDASFSVRPYVTSKYVALGEEYKKLRGSEVTITYDPNADAEAALANAKTAAKEELTAYKNGKDLSLYRPQQQSELAQILTSGCQAIDSAVDEAGVATALSAAKRSLDAVKTDAELTREEQEAALQSAMASACSELETYVDPALYRDNEKQLIADIIIEGKTNIQQAEDLAEVANALAAAEALLDDVKTDAEYTAEEQGQGGEDNPDAKALAEAKNNAELELGSYMAPEEYRDAEKALLLEILTTGRAAIDAAETKEEVTALLAEYKGKIDALKTDAEYTREEEEARKKQEEAEQKAKAAAIKKAKAAKTTVKVKALTKHRAKVTWKKVSGVTGYKVYRAAKKSGKYKLIKTINKAKTLKYTNKKLKKGKKYFYKVRTYTVIDDTTYLGKWSKVCWVKAK